MSRYLFRLDPDHTNFHECFGTPFHVGGIPTGSLLTMSIEPNAQSVWRRARVTFQTGSLFHVPSVTSSMVVLPLFPTGSLPRRFVVEMDFQVRDLPVSNFFFHLLIGNQGASVNNLHSHGQGFFGNETWLTTNGNTISVTTATAINGGWTETDGSGYNTLRRLFEQKTTTPQTIDDVVWQMQDWRSTTMTNNTFGRTHTLSFTGSYGSGFTGSVLNKLYLGVRTSGATGSMARFMDIFNLAVRKHPLDED